MIKAPSFASNGLLGHFTAQIEVSRPVSVGHNSLRNQEGPLGKPSGPGLTTRSPRLLLTAPSPQLTGHPSYVLITPIHADKKQKKVTPRRFGPACFESMNPDAFQRIMHDLRHGALMREVMEHYQVPQSTVVLLRKHYKDLMPAFDRGASTRVEVKRKAEVAQRWSDLRRGDR
jgi:hypothetical protein